MDGIILREHYDENLQQIFRLKMFTNGSVCFTSTKAKRESSPSICLAKPILAQIRVTKRCNLRCPYCYAEDASKAGDMSDEQLWELLDICDREGILAITWTGGEPLIRDCFLSIVRETHLRGIRQTILTNGTLLDRVLMDRFPKNNLNFQISLNNVWTNMDDCRSVIKNAATLFHSGYDVLLQAILEEVPIEIYADLLEVLVAMQIPSIKFGIKIPVGAAASDNWSKYENSIMLLIPKLISLREQYRSRIKILYQFDKATFHFTGLPRRFLMCEAGTTQIYIDNNGDAYPCPLLKSYSEMKCGNVFDTDWVEIWNSFPMEALRSIGECSDCNYNCKVWCRALKYSTDGLLTGKSHFCLKKF